MSQRRSGARDAPRASKVSVPSTRLKRIHDVHRFLSSRKRESVLHPHIQCPTAERLTPIEHHTPRPGAVAGNRFPCKRASGCGQPIPCDLEIRFVVGVGAPNPPCLPTQTFPRLWELSRPIFASSLWNRAIACSRVCPCPTNRLLPRVSSRERSDQSPVSARSLLLRSQSWTLQRR